MADLREIYQEVILDHYRRPRNFKVLESASQEARGHNPLCGDRIHVFLEIEHLVVKEVSFQGAGCAISTASASMMSEAVKGKTFEEAMRLFHLFHERMTGAEDLKTEDLGKLEAFSGVREIPVRVKCATLAWHTLKAALSSTASENSNVRVSTE